MQHAGVFFGAVVGGLLIIKVNHDIPIMIIIFTLFVFSIVLLYFITQFREIYLSNNVE
jgi:hypothetical protein